MKKINKWFKKNKEDIIGLSLAYFGNFLGIYLMFFKGWGLPFIPIS